MGADAYRQLLAERERARLEAFADVEEQNPTNFLEEQSSSSDAIEAKPSTLKKIGGAVASTIGETATAGVKHFAKGISDTVVSLVQEGPSGLKTQAEGVGEAVLGALTLLYALPSGNGELFEQTVTTLTPGAEHTTLLPSIAAGAVRSLLTLPALLDPEFRQLVFKDRESLERVLEKLSEPMSVAEAANIIGSFAGFPLQARGFRALRAATKRTKVGTPTVATPSTEPPVAAQAAQAPDIITKPLRVQAAIEQGQAPRGALRGSTLPDVDALTARLLVLSEQLRKPKEKGEPKTEIETPKVETPTIEPEAKSLQTTQELALERTSHFDELRSSLETGLRRAEEIIREELQVETPKVETPKVETPKAEAPPKKRATRGAIPKSITDVVNTKLGDGGFVSPMLLARMAVGAAMGGTQGDTPEERVAFALGGAGLAAFGPGVAMKIAKRVTDALRREAPRVLDESNPRVPGYTPEGKPTEPLRSGNMTIDDLVNKFAAGEAFTPVEMRQAQHIQTQAVQRVFDIAKRIRAGEAVPNGALRHAMFETQVLDSMLNESPLGERGLGRGVQDRVKDATTLFDQLSRDYDPGVPESFLARLITELPKAVKIDTAIRLYHAIPGTIGQVMYGSMLTGKAIVKNGISNLFMVPLGAVNRSLASLGAPGKIKFTDGAEGFYAAWEAAIDQLTMLRRRDWQSFAAEAEQYGLTHIEIHPRGFGQLAELAAESGWSRWAAAFDRLSTVFNVGPTIMRFTDAASKAVNQRMATKFEALTRARELGSTNFDEAVAFFVDHPNQLPVEALARIKDFRDHQTFTKPFENEFLKLAQRGFDDPVADLIYRMTVGTFVRTPIRLAEINFEMTPGLNVLSTRFRGEMTSGDPIRRATAEAQLASGMIIIGTMMYLSMQGLITGDPLDENQRVAWRDAGRPPRGFWDPLAQKYRSYAGMEPFSTLIATGANLAYAVGRLPEGDALALLAAVGLAVTPGIDSTPFMEGIGELLDVFRTGRTDVGLERSADYIRRRLGMFNPSILREIKPLFDDANRRTVPTPAFDEDKSMTGMLLRETDLLRQDFTRTLPGFAGKLDRNMFTGEPIITDTWPFNPFTTTPAQPAPWAREIARLNGAGLRRIDQFIGRKPAVDVNLSDKPVTSGVRLTTPELDRLEVLMTQVVKDAHGKLTDSLNALITSDIYRRQQDVVKRDLLQQRFTAFKLLAEARLLSENASLRQAVVNQARGVSVDRLPSDHPSRGLRQELDLKLKNRLEVR